MTCKPVKSFMYFRKLDDCPHSHRKLLICKTIYVLLIKLFGYMENDCFVSLVHEKLLFGQWNTRGKGGERHKIDEQFGASNRELQPQGLARTPIILWESTYCSNRT